MKIIGTTVTNDLNWNMNSQNITQNVNRRMLLLTKIHKFRASIKDMVQLWKSYCLSIFEQSSVVWGNFLSAANKNDLERIKKMFHKIFY